MYLDNFYFVVSNIEKSIEFYSTLLDAKPSGVLGLYADNIDAAYARCKELGAKSSINLKTLTRKIGHIFTKDELIEARVFFNL